MQNSSSTPTQLHSSTVASKISSTSQLNTASTSNNQTQSQSNNNNPQSLPSSSYQQVKQQSSLTVTPFNSTNNTSTHKTIHQSTTNNLTTDNTNSQFVSEQPINSSVYQSENHLKMSTITTAGIRLVPRLPKLPSHLPSALDHLEGLIKTWVHEGRRVVFFLDYDGTLSPIVDDPDRATIPQATRDALSVVASRFTTAIVSGRSLEKVMSMVRLNQLIYAGSHGFDIKGPKGRIEHRVASDFLPQLHAAKEELLELVPLFPGSSVEDNLLSISFHFRKVDSSMHEKVEHRVKHIAEKHGLVRTNGKMVHELRPLFDWHKGKAVEYLLQVLKLMGPEVVPIYIGDDVTDEDAFKVLNGRGISVIVADSSLSRNTYADMRLNDPIEVQRFLKHFAEDTSLSALTVTSE